MRHCPGDGSTVEKPSIERELPDMDVEGGLVVSAFHWVSAFLSNCWLIYPFIIKTRYRGSSHEDDLN
ncbi:hypothetical protein, partial [Photorhabdus australis]|uniref:hypothetical protein n=1 Tax=Photorhabdus australis TaxID=286156 RepID=UPI001969CE70